MLPIITTAAAGFIVSFLLHVLIWNNLKPKKQMFLLALIFLLLPSVIYIALSVVSPGFFNIVNTLLILILEIGLSGVYIMTYPAMQAECPTLKIILEVAKSMPQGLSEDAIRNIFSAEKLFVERVEDLVSEGFVFFKENKIYLSAKGRILSGVFLGYRNLLGLPLGEG